MAHLYIMYRSGGTMMGCDKLHIPKPASSCELHTDSLCRLIGIKTQYKVIINIHLYIGTLIRYIDKTRKSTL